MRTPIVGLSGGTIDSYPGVEDQVRNNLEGFAVSEVGKVLARVDRLGSVLQQNDRTLLTDGHIDIFSGDGQQKKQDFDGRVEVQIKSKSVRTPDDVPHTYRIKVDDLLGYRKIGGVLFFHVAVIGEDPDSRITYATLTPFRIDKLLKKRKARSRSLTFHLKDLPKDVESIEHIVRFQQQSQAETHARDASQFIQREGTSLTVHSDEISLPNEPVDLEDPARTFMIVATTADGLSSPVSLSGKLVRLTSARRYSSRSAAET